MKYPQPKPRQSEQDETPTTIVTAPRGKVLETMEEFYNRVGDDMSWQRFAEVAEEMGLPYRIIQ